MRHLTLQQLSATVDQALSGVSLELVRRHLEECEECRARGSKLARVDGVVAQLVSHDPGDAWLEAVAVEVEERVRAEVAGRFDPPAHPAGPPPLEFAGGTPVLSPDELEKIWEEGSTTPRPSSTKTRETVAEPMSAAASDATTALPNPLPVNATAPNPAPASVVTTAETKTAPVASAPPVAKAAAAKPESPTARPAAARPPVPAAKPDASDALAPAATKRVPPPRHRAPAEEPPMRWGQHADRVVRARREASSAERETFLPIAFGLVGGALAGALVVTLFFLRHGAGTAPAAPVVHSVSSPRPPAAIEDPVSHPEIEPVPTKEVPAAVTPPLRKSPGTEAAATTRVSPLPVSAGSAKPRSVAPASPTSTATPPRVRTEPGAAAARAIPTGEESWPLLCGEVVDESGAEVTGARILLADLDVGARTDRRGRFCVAAPPGDRTLSVVALGFATQRRVVSMAIGAADIRVVLKATP